LSAGSFEEGTVTVLGSYKTAVVHVTASW